MENKEPEQRRTEKPKEKVLRYFYNPADNGFYILGIHREVPEESIEISEEKWLDLTERRPENKMVSSDSEGNPILVDQEQLPKDRLERLWRNRELKFVDHKVADSMDRGELEMEDKWRQYRVALRDWPENSDFPNSEKRPQRPGD